MENSREVVYTYEPTGPYKTPDGIGYRKQYKGMTLETIFFKDPGFLYKMLLFAQRKVDIGIQFRNHIEWLFAASEQLPLLLPPCNASGCKEKATLISIRQSYDGQEAISLIHVYCSNHFEEEKQRNPLCSSQPWHISSMRLLPKNNNLFRDHMQSVLKIKKLTAKKIFWHFKESLPKWQTAIKVALDADQQREMERLDKIAYSRRFKTLPLFN